VTGVDGIGRVHCRRNRTGGWAVRRKGLLSLAVGLIGVAAAAAQAWPSKPIKVIVPVTAGSAMDIVARLLADEVGRQMGHTFVVENRTGAGGTIGAAAVATAEPDGHTILIHTTALTIHPSTFANLPYHPARDLSGIMPVVNTPLVLVVSANKYRSAAELVAAAKAKPEGINYATVGAGAAAHLTAERFRLSAGFKAQQIPFRGAPEAITEVMTDRVEFFFSPILPALPLLRDGKIRALAVSSAKRASALPEVPTTLELGYANSNFEFWIGTFMQARTPRSVIDRLYQEMRTAIGKKEALEKLAKLGGEPMHMTPAEFDRFVQQQIEASAELVKAAGIKPN
jgi:tripartite-type tricarboxylate transporter receptor subunit TctC